MQTWYCTYRPTMAATALLKSYNAIHFSYNSKYKQYIAHLRQ
jgi:hypothetical protein